MALAFIIVVFLRSLSFNAFALTASSRESVYRPVLVNTHVRAAFTGYDIMAQMREVKADRKALFVKARTKEMQIIAADIGTLTWLDPSSQSAEK